MRTARAKGLREHVLIRRHLLKNSMIPVVTVLGPLLAFLIVGSLVVENIFSVPGIGRLLVQGISQRDYSLIMGSTLVYAIVIAVLNLIVDVGYAFIDPRIGADGATVTSPVVAPGRVGTAMTLYVHAHRAVCIAMRGGACYGIDWPWWA
jgi:ABC-type microcin C transport system permease subunit YejB